MTTIIESLTDRAAYIALGASNATPGATDDETVTWALEATRASIADTATDDDRAGRGVGRAEGDVGGAIGEALDDGHHGR
jgi:hypothetical protein